MFIDASTVFVANLKFRFVNSSRRIYHFTISWNTNMLNMRCGVESLKVESINLIFSIMSLILRNYKHFIIFNCQIEFTQCLKTSFLLEKEYVMHFFFQLIFIHSK